MGGQAGGIALGAQVVVVNDASEQWAHIDSGAQINRAGGTLQVTASADRTVDAQAIGLQAGVFAAGASIAFVDVSGATKAWVDGDVGQATGMAVRNVTISAVSVADVDAQVVQGSITAGFGVTGAIAIATVDSNVEASTGSQSDIAASGTVTIRTETDLDGKADSLAAAISAGAGVGASIAVLSVRPVQTTRVGGSIRTSGSGSVLLEAESNSGTEAKAYAMGGGLLAGAAGAFALVDNSSKIQTEVASGGSIDAAGSVTLSSVVEADAYARAFGIAAGSFAVGGWSPMQCFRQSSTPSSAAR